MPHSPHSRRGFLAASLSVLAVTFVVKPALPVKVILYFQLPYNG